MAKVRATKICPVDGIEFVPVRSQIYCTTKCRDATRTARVPRETCGRCGQPRGDGSHPEYCRACQRLFAQESYRQRKAAGTIRKNELCARCHEPRTGRHPTYCQDCWRGPMREAHYLEPCSRCKRMRQPGDRTHDAYCYPCYRDLYLQREFGITLERFDAILVAQGGVCAVDARPLDVGGDRALGIPGHVDHDHRCCPGKKSCGACVRGVLCGECNRGIGLLGESSGRLRRAADYLDGILA